MDDTNNLVQLTAEIVEATVASNKVLIGDIPGLISSTYEALSGLREPAPEPVIEKPKGAVSARASIKPDYLVSMIDGKPYKALRRHLSRHGYTPETYREAFGLPDSYPMVAAAYSAQRREMAEKFGLGRKAAGKPAEAPQEALDAVKVKGQRKANETSVEAPTGAEKPKRGRPRKAKPIIDDFFDPAAA